MSDTVGQSIVTADGINAIIQAQAQGSNIKPKYFRFSEQELVLDPTVSSGDIEAWITRDISNYLQIDSNTVEFTCDIKPAEATNYTKVAGLYLEDGTLFALAKPPFAFPPMLRQTFKIQITYQGIGSIMDFSYLSNNETEQHASDIANLLFTADMRSQCLKDTTKITKIEGRYLR